MSTRMLIDAAHPEETRVAVVRGNRIEEFDFEAANKSSFRGNIYLARVTRVEPSLQAAFIEYGGNRHGFLAFSEIHPDYYQIPIEDREALLKEEEQEQAAAASDDDEASAKSDSDGENGPEVEEVGASDGIEDVQEQRRKPLQRRYKIQEVIKKRQILLVQVVKEERGNKGAALTTYMSLAGRYCVLMPNTARGGGISRKIPHHSDRNKLKKIMSELDVPKGMGCIIRTAGASRTKTEIKRDYTYLMRLWDNIRELTLESVAPALIYEEGDLIKRVIRDMYASDVEEVLVEGPDGYREAKDFMKMLMPSHAKRVKQYKEDIPLFHRFQVESQLETMYSATVPLKSGGYLVINPTEALVAVDVNSGRSTRERNIEKTAHKTNLEAAEEVARQLRLRDLAGLIVIDFIDMEENRNNRSVERKMKEALKSDRARLQVGRISPFGLMEMSRQRLRPGLLEASTGLCPVCEGTGAVRSTESSVMQLLRVIEEEGIRGRCQHLTITVPSDVSSYMLNNKRTELVSIEQRFSIGVSIEVDDSLHRPHYELKREGQASPDQETKFVTPDQFTDDDSDDDTTEAKDTNEDKGNRNRRSRSKDSDSDSDNNTNGDNENRPEGSDDREPKKRRRRGRRGGRRRRRDQDGAQENVQESQNTAEQDTANQPAEAGDQPEIATDVVPEWSASTPAPANEDGDTSENTKSEQDDVKTDDSTEPAAVDNAEPAKDEKPKRKPRTRSRSRKPKKEAAAPPEADETSKDDAVVVAAANEPESANEEPASSSADAEPAAEPISEADKTPQPEAEEDENRPRRTGWWNREAGE